MELTNPDDLKRMQEHFEKLNRLISVEGDQIVLRVASEYPVPLSGCSSYEGILGWVFHLSEKTWMSAELLRHFMRVAFDASDLDIPQV